MNGLSKHKTRPIPEQQQQFARALGWFSIGLGAAEILFPNVLSRLIGIKPRHKTLFRLLGVRELTSGLGILSESKYPGWVWSRVSGDAMDLGLLGLALAMPGTKHKRLMAATVAVAGVTALDVLCSEEMTRTRKNGGGNNVTPLGKIRVKSAITILRPPDQLYRFWRNFENLPQVMYYIDSVKILPDGRSLWKAKGPLNKPVEWHSELTEDRPNELIAWRTLPGSQVQHTGSVQFEVAPGGRGTVVRVEMEYQSPGGLLGATIAKLMHREPGQELHDALRYFRQLMETGEVSTTVGQPAGRPSGTSKKFDFPTPRLREMEQPKYVN